MDSQPMQAHLRVCCDFTIVISFVLSLFFEIILFFHKCGICVTKCAFLSSSRHPFKVASLKLALAIIAAVLAALVLVFVSIRENEIGTREWIPVPNFRGFWVTKNWAFYVEGIVCLISILLVILCLMENSQASYGNKHDRHNPNYAMGGSTGNLSAGPSAQTAAGRESSSSPYQPCSGKFSSTFC